MNLPWEISLFGTSFYLHFFIEALAFFIGIRYYYFLRKQQPDYISDTNRLWIMLGAMLGALLGSRIIGLLEVKDFYENFTLMKLYSNKTVLGGFLGGLFGVEIFKYFIGEKQSSGDLYVLPIILALFIGRIGCFSMGIAEPTFGIETNFFTGMNLGDGILRHPIMLYEMAYLVLLFIFFKILLNRKFNSYQTGDSFKIFMLFYFGFRFFMEFLKPHYDIFLGLSIIQWCGIFIYLYYYKFFIRLLR